MKSYHLIAVFVLASFVAVQAKKKPVVTERFAYGQSNSGTRLEINFERGKEHNHPLFAIWLADESGKYIQTLYVSSSVGKGVFNRVDKKSGMWKSGEIQRPASLPYWAYQRNIQNEQGYYLPSPKMPVVDAYTGATPSSSFIMNCVTETKLSGRYKILIEINQTWDWNEYWTNDKYPNDVEYATSCQPALVYEALIDSNQSSGETEFKAIGHSHYAGADGSLNTDLSTMTTSLKIAKKITVKILP